MKKSKFTEEQIVGILRETDRDPVATVAKRHGVSDQAIYTWKAKVVIEAWRKHFNEVRPHSSLGYLTPAEFAAKLQQTNAAPASATGRDAARHGGFAPRPVAAPSELGQLKEQETPALPT